MNGENLNQAFGWDDEIPESSFEVLPDGDYAFMVTNFERAKFEPRNPNSKIGRCNQANVEFTINWTTEDGREIESKLTYRLKLWNSLSFMIYQFFESIGLKKKGDGTSAMPWDKILGRTGVCKIGRHDDDKGNSYNDIVKCYPVEDAPKVTKNKPVTAPPQYSL